MTYLWKRRIQNKQNINQLIIHPELKKEKKNIVKTRCEEKFLIIGRLKIGGA